MADRSGGKMLLGSNADLLMVTGANLRVRYDGRKKQSVSLSAFGTADAADTQPGDSGRKLDASIIVAMYGHTGRMTAGTGQLMKLNTIYDRIIKGLRNKVAILDKNGYHSIVNGHGFIHACWAMADRTFSGCRSAVFLLRSL